MNNSNKAVAAVALACGVGLSIMGCSSTTATEYPAQTAEVTEVETREAGVKGTRVCFVNDTNLSLSIAPADPVDEDYTDHIIGEKGPIPSGSQVCYAGWNSYEAVGWEVKNIPSIDVSAAISIDGNYNALYFRGSNSAFSQAQLAWTSGKQTDNPYPSVLRDEDIPLNKADSVAGHPFTVTMVEDSEFYKEFVVRFTN